MQMLGVIFIVLSFLIPFANSASVLLVIISAGAIIIVYSNSEIAAYSKMGFRQRKWIYILVITGFAFEILFLI